MKVWTKVKGARVIEITFDGTHYAFNDLFAGLLAIATRKGSSHLFKVEYGNSHNYYPSDNEKDLKFVEDFITKQETKYVKDIRVMFDPIAINVDTTYYLTIGINKY